jgi:hypothetical protein
VQELDAWPIGDQVDNLAAEVDHGSRACGRWDCGRRRRLVEEVADLLLSGMAGGRRGTAAVGAGICGAVRESRWVL